MRDSLSFLGMLYAAPVTLCQLEPMNEKLEEDLVQSGELGTDLQIVVCPANTEAQSDPRLSKITLTPELSAADKPVEKLADPAYKAHECCHGEGEKDHDERGRAHLVPGGPAHLPHFHANVMHVSPDSSARERRLLFLLEDGRFFPGHVVLRHAEPPFNFVLGHPSANSDLAWE
jgi:hypothetical protein